jgi:hypothetical protein
LDQGIGVPRFLKMLLSALRNKKRRFPPMPLGFLELQTTLADTAARRIFYDVLAVEERGQAGEFLAAALLRETDKSNLKHGTDLLAGLLSERKDS